MNEVTSISRCAAAVWAILAIAIAGTGCDEDVVAVLGTDRAFSLYGVLTPQADTQWVRVYTIDPSLEPIPNRRMDAVFTSHDGNSTVTWTDSIITESDGMLAHAFYSPFAAIYGRDYDIAVERSDGAASRVSVRVPPFSELLLPPQSQSPPPVLTATITGNPPNLIRVEVDYEYIFRSFSGTERLQTRVSYDGEAVPGIESWLLPIQVSRDQRAIQSSIKESTGLDIDIKIVKITVRLIVANTEWSAPGGVFDRELLVEPGLMSNVSNGFGFVGAGFRLEGAWVPTDTILVKAGFEPGPTDVELANLDPNG